MFRKLFLLCLCLSVVVVRSVEHEKVVNVSDQLAAVEVQKPTPKPTPKPTTTTTSTSKPTEKTTTAATTTTTVAPHPAPSPVPPQKNATVLPVQENPKKAEKGAWIVRDAHNVTQLIIETQAVLHFEYAGNEKAAKWHSVDLNLPTNATVELTTDTADLKNVTLKWSLEKSRNNSLSFQFWMNKTKGVYDLSAISAVIYPTAKYFVNYTAANESIEIRSNGTVFGNTPVNSSYVCISDVSPALVAAKHKNLTYTITMSFTHFEAFTGKNFSSFSLAVECDMDGNALLPLIAAVILIILIVTVLVFYLINRRRPQAEGYTSM